MLNHRAFKRKQFASHLVGVLTYLVCVVPEPGEYVITIWSRQQVYRKLFLVAREGSSHSQIDIDLASLVSASSANVNREIVAKGLLVFYSSGGGREFRVTVAHKKDRGGKSIFDSENLSSSDHFVFIPVLTGEYDVALASHKVEGTILVIPPDGKKLPVHLFEPKHVTLAKDGFEPRRIEAFPGQPIVFTIRTSTKFEITLSASRRVEQRRSIH